MQQVRDLGDPRRVGLGRLVTREREPRHEGEREHERGPAQLEPIENPGDEEERRDDPEPERHHEKRDAETCLLGERLEIAVREVGDRELQRVRRAQDECGDADVDHEERCDHRNDVEATLERPAAPTSSQDHEPDDERPDQQRERGEEPPPGEVVAPRRARRADGLGRRRRRNADAEREHPSPGGARRLRSPSSARCSRGREASRETGATTTYPSSSVRARPRDDRSVGREHLDGVRRDGDRPVEAKPDSRRRRVDARLRHGVRAHEVDVGERRRRRDERARAPRTRRTRPRVTARSTRSDRRWARRPDRRRGGRRAARR